MRLNNVHFINVGGVSIHASVKDATFPISPESIDKSVSIHASVKDATRVRASIVNSKRFNPRICKRCDYADDVSDPN